MLILVFLVLTNHYIILLVTNVKHIWVMKHFWFSVNSRSIILTIM